MQNGNMGFGGTRWGVCWWPPWQWPGRSGPRSRWRRSRRATFRFLDFLKLAKAGHWGEGSSSIDSTPTKLVHPTVTSTFAIPGKSFGITGGSFDFNHWDLAEARQLADVRPDYHMVKNYKLLGRFDTLFIKDADFFAYYRPWYDAFGSIKDRWPPASEHRRHSIDEP